MGIKITFTPTGDVVEDKEIVVQGEVHNAREYMEQFKANHCTSFGINSQRNVFFAPKKRMTRLLDQLFQIFAFFVFYTEQYKKNCSKSLLGLIGMLCLAAIFIYWCCSSIK